MIDKSYIRARIKARKSLLSEVEREVAASKVFARLEQSAAFIMAESVLMYHSLPDELSTREFLEKWSPRKRFYLPRVNGVNLEILPYDRSRLAMGAFHIEEPQGDATTDISEIELVVVPAVAYDRKGNRIGRGKGYYDRLLAKSKATKIGVGYDFQLSSEEFAVEPHDVGVDIVITESQSITVRHS